MGAVFADRFIRSIRDLLKRPFFERGDANWFDISPTKTKQNKNRIYSLTKLTPIQASLRKSERLVYTILLGKRKRIKPQFQVNDLVRTADSKKSFPKSVTTNRSYKLYKITEIIDDTIPSYRNDNLNER